ncbi:MAG: lytic transglycosylase domain-containing protein [Gemmatimonadetes bacterium]|nr:lytic transglycosylase domain-containing protein [Gemmatimonadota bacterium]
MARAAARLVIAAALAAVCIPPTLSGQETYSGAADAALPDSVRHHLADGRYWRASLALRAHLEPIASAPLAARMVLANAEAGWKNWNGAVAALSAGSIDTAQAPPRVWYLLGISRGAAGDRTGAAADLRRFLAATGTDTRETLVAGARLAVLLADGASPEEALPVLEELRTRSPVVAGWAALAVARAHAEQGRAEAVPAALALIADPAVRRRGWSLESDAWADAGDTARALEALARAEAAESGDAPPRVPFLARQWRYRLALGDSTGAVDAMEALLRETTSGAAALAAAKAHWRVAEDSGPDVLRLVARAHAGGGEFGTAVIAWRLVAERGGVLTERERLAEARAFTGSGALAAAITAYRPLAESDDPAVAATALREWAAVRARQGRHGDARTVQGWLVERYPASSGALDVIFFRADDHQDAGRLDDAIEHYRQVVSMSSGADRAGLSRMRWAQIHLGRDEQEAAAEVYGAYLEEFPNGRRWEEASYWGARAAQAAGDAARAAEWLDRLRRESPYSYYGFLAGRGDTLAAPDDATASPFGAPPQGCLVPPPPDWLARQLEVLATLQEAGLEDGAEAHIDAMRTAVWDSDELLLRLGTALNAAGYPIDGIRMGRELRDRGREWDCALLRVVYPFPYRDLLTSRAEELGLDPWLVAGLVRQESAFHPSIVSPAGAIGLMQVMPATGRQLARASGVRDFTTETLENAEVNVHLGTRFLAELFERYDGDVPLFLSAYNAGPTRANRWRRMPEAADAERFTERIPFAETRGYVKNVTRNRALYRWLYGSGGTTPE